MGPYSNNSYRDQEEDIERRQLPQQSQAGAGGLMPLESPRRSLMGMSGVQQEGINLNTNPSPEQQYVLNQFISTDKGFTNEPNPSSDPIVEENRELGDLSKYIANRIGENLQQNQDVPYPEWLEANQDNILYSPEIENEAYRNVDSVYQPDGRQNLEPLPQPVMEEGLGIQKEYTPPNGDPFDPGAGTGVIQPQDPLQPLPEMRIGGGIYDDPSKDVQKAFSKQKAEDVDYVMDVMNLSPADFKQLEADYYTQNPNIDPEMVDSRDIMNWAKEEVTRDMSPVEKRMFEENLIRRDPRLSDQQKMLNIWSGRTPPELLEKGYISTPVRGLYKDLNQVDPGSGEPMTSAEVKFIGERVSTYNNMFAGFDNIGQVLDSKGSPELLGELLVPGSEVRTRLRNEIQSIYVESIGDNFYKRGANFTAIEKKMLEKFIVNLESNSPLKVAELKDMYEQTQQLFTRKMSMALKSYGYYTEDMPSEEEFNNWSIRVHNNRDSGVPEFSVRLHWTDPETGKVSYGESDMSVFRKALDEAPDDETRKKLLDFVVPSKNLDR